MNTEMLLYKQEYKQERKEIKSKIFFEEINQKQKTALLRTTRQNQKHATNLIYYAQTTYVLLLK